jgi:GTPase
LKKPEPQKEISDALGPQNEQVKDVEEILIHPNKKTTVFFQFLYNPEYIGIGNNLIINMENFKAFGTITQLITDKI